VEDFRRSVRDDAHVSIITLARYFIARLPNWRQISRASPLGPSVATLVAHPVVQNTHRKTGVARRRERFATSQLGSLTPP